MRSYALSLVLFATAVFILRAGLMIEMPLPVVEDHRHGEVFKPGEVLVDPPHQITAYCTCPVCCGAWSDGYTASGTLATQGRTAAADTIIWPMGTCLAIPGVGERIVEDTGSAIKWRAIDVFIDNHEEARKFGVRFVNVKEC